MVTYTYCYRMERQIDVKMPQAVKNIMDNNYK